MILLLECQIQEKLMSHLLWLVITFFGLLIVIWFDMTNDIPAKISQPSFGGTKAWEMSSQM